MAQTFYVRQGASGGGTDWTNAYAALPATLTRGATYYIADGTYSGYTFDDAESGTSLITIKKATQADHGTETGWTPGYGDGVASWGPWGITTSYWHIDGQVGGGPDSWATGHGFSVFSSTSKLVQINGTNLTDITLAHIEFDSDRGATFIGGITGTNVGTSVNNLLIEYCAVREVFGALIHTRAWSVVTVQYSYFFDNKNTAADHSEAVSTNGANDNWVIRWNLFDSIEGTAVFAGINVSSHDNWQIYGNVFSRSRTVVNIIDDASNDSSMSNSEFLNNTILDYPGVSQGGLRTNTGSGNISYNNIYYNNDANSFRHTSNWVADYDYAELNIRSEGGPFDKDAEVILGQANGWKEAGNPFVSYNSNPLIADLSPVEGFFDANAGFDTGAIVPGNNVDAFGRIRGLDGTWDRGAYEFAPAGGGDPPPPPGNRVVIKLAMLFALAAGIAVGYMQHNREVRTRGKW